MSEFLVDVRKIKKVSPHSNADLLDIAEVEGLSYQFVVKKNSYKEGDLCVYFPIDSELPDELSTTLGVKPYLGGPNKKVVKTAKLRGEISQGLSIPVKVISNIIGRNVTIGENLTEVLNVLKYEPATPISTSCDLHVLPTCLPVYDIENAERLPELVEFILDKKVVITEKLEGMNFAASVINKNGELHFEVSQKNYIIKEKENCAEHSFHKLARQKKLHDLILEIIEKENIKIDNIFSLRGEFIGQGVQKNIYKLRDYDVYIFDILIDGKYLDKEIVIQYADKYFEKYNLKMVPVIANNILLREFIGNNKLSELSNGKSVLNESVLREGIVISPPKEERVKIINISNDDSTGEKLFLNPEDETPLEYINNRKYSIDIERIIFKQRSPEYLLK